MRRYDFALHIGYTLGLEGVGESEAEAIVKTLGEVAYPSKRSIRFRNAFVRGAIREYKDGVRSREIFKRRGV
jgi:hypothetical protein